MFTVGSGVANVPGPIDFRGALGAGLLLLLNELGGKWLCLRLRSTGASDGACMDSEIEFCLLAVLDVVLCCLFKEPARPIEPVPDAFRTLPVLLTGRGMIDVSSDLGRSWVEAAGALYRLKPGSVVVMLLWKSSKLTCARSSAPKSKDAVSSSCQRFEFSGAMDAKLKRDMLLIDSCCS